MAPGSGCSRSIQITTRPIAEQPDQTLTAPGACGPRVGRVGPQSRTHCWPSRGSTQAHVHRSTARTESKRASRWNSGPCSGVGRQHCPMLIRARPAMRFWERSIKTAPPESHWRSPRRPGRHGCTDGAAANRCTAAGETPPSRHAPPPPWSSCGARTNATLPTKWVAHPSWIRPQPIGIQLALSEPCQQGHLPRQWIGAWVHLHQVIKGPLGREPMAAHQPGQAHQR